MTHAFIGDGVCNDETNIAGCNYDGGDCCRYNINTERCTECMCFAQEMCQAGVHPFVGDGVCNDETNIAECGYDGLDCCLNPNTVGDGICNDGTNHPECNYDGGDCCLMNVNTDSCSECNCLEGGVITSPGFPGNYDNNLDLTWLIQVEMGQTIGINFLSFDVEYHASCK